MKYWHNLNLLRGVGALMIVVHHANSDSIPLLEKVPGLIGFIIARTRNFGWSGIDLFFVLGGFLMAHTFCQHFERHQTIQVQSYYKARAKRIVPSYYFLLLVLAVTGATGWLDLSSLGIALQDILIHFLFINNYLDELPNGPTWYVAAIVQIYLIMPLLLLTVARFRHTDMEQTIRQVAILGILLVPVLRCWTVLDGTHQDNDFMQTHFRVDTVMQGMLAYLLLRARHPIVKRIKSHPYATLFLAALLIFPCIFLSRTNVYMFSVGFTFLALGYSLLILVLVQKDFMVPKMLSIFLFAVSTWSYNIYLWHFFIPRIIGQPYTDLQILIDSTIGSAGLQNVVQIFLFVVVSIIVGFIMTNLIEKPAARFLS